MAKLTSLVNNKQYDLILKRTSDYRLYKDIDSVAYVYKIGFRVQALVLCGRFSEAESLCYEAIDSGRLSEKNLFFINYYLYLTYYYTKQYIKCIGLLENFTSNDKFAFKRKDYLMKSIIQESDDQSYNDLFHIPTKIFVKHVTNRRGFHSNTDLKMLAGVIKSNFYNARAYYENLTEFRIFRFFNVGKSNYNGKLQTCDYVQVVSLKNDPESLITCYFIDNPGSLEFYDLTPIVSENMIKHKVSNVPGIKNNIEKFYSRQRKKDAKIEN